MRQFGLRPGKIKIEPLKYQLSMKICPNGNADDCKLMRYVEAGNTVVSLIKLISNTYISIPKKHQPIKLYNEEGIIIKDLNHIKKNFTNIFYVFNKRHWMWPPTKLGHIIYPKYVSTDEVNGKNSHNSHKKSSENERFVSMKTLSLSPKVFLIENFLSEDEIEYLINHGKKYLAPSHIGIGKEKVDNDFRTSKTAWDTKSDISISIQRRAFALARIPFRSNVHLTDAIQIVRYGKHNMFKLHTDYFKSGYDNIDSSKPDGTNRYITIFMYLNDGFVGGKTIFPHSKTHLNGDQYQNDPNLLNSNSKFQETKNKMPSCLDDTALAVKPKRGSAILFYNQLHDGTVDLNSEHGGCPIVEGEKFGANVWIWNAKRPKFK